MIENMQSLFHAGDISPSETLKKENRVFGFSSIDNAKLWKKRHNKKHIYQFFSSDYKLDSKVYGGRPNENEFICKNVIKEIKVEKINLSESMISSSIWKAVKKLVKSPIQAGILAMMIAHFLKKKEESYTNRLEAIQARVGQQLKIGQQWKRVDVTNRKDILTKRQKGSEVLWIKIQKVKDSNNYIYILFRNNKKLMDYDKKSDAVEHLQSEMRK